MAGISLTETEPTAFALIGAPCPPDLRTVSVTGLKLDHRFHTNSWHILVCIAVDGIRFVLLEHRVDPDNRAVLPANLRADGTCGAAQQVVRLTVSWAGGLDLVGRAGARTTEPILLERTAISGGRPSLWKAKRCTRRAGPTWCR